MTGMYTTSNLNVTTMKNMKLNPYGSVLIFFTLLLISTLSSIAQPSFSSVPIQKEGNYPANNNNQEFHSAVSTPHPEAKKAAAEILAKGGNAVDAGCSCPVDTYRGPNK